MDLSSSRPLDNTGRVAILGIGLLGAGFAEHLLDLGVEVIVWNRSPGKTDALAARGALVAASPAEAVAQASRVHLVLTADDAVDAVLAALTPALPADVFVLDHSTNAPTRVAERCAKVRAAGVRYVHAPVFMAPVNARAGSGLMLIACDEHEAAAITPALRTMTGKVWHVGARSDLAAVHKLIGNGLLVSISGAFGDLFTLGAAQGLSTDDVLRTFEEFQAGASLPAFGRRVAARGTNAVGWELETARKDVRLMIEAADGPEDLVVLPALAAAMDTALAEGFAETDYAVFAWPRGRDAAKGA